MAKPTLLVTGASTGIGRALALHFSQQGWETFGTVRRQQDTESLRAEGVTPVLLDVTDEGSVSAAVQQVAAAVGSRGLDVLVNNAGIATFGPLELAALEQWRSVFETNVFGVATVTRHFLPLLRIASGHTANTSGTHTSSSSSSSSQKPGPGAPAARMLVVGSAAGRLASPLQSVYTASKHAVEGLVDALRYELAPQGIKVVLMQLGAVATALPGKLRASSAADMAAAAAEVAAIYKAQVEETLDLFDSLESKTIPMQVVMAAFEAAATAANPRTRYAIDSQISAALWLKWALPDKTWDWVFPKLMAMSKSKAKDSNSAQPSKQPSMPPAAPVPVPTS